MANPILKDDLISKEALDALERMSKLLHDDALAMEAMIRATGQYAGSLGSMIQQQQQDNAALQTYADRIENLENALAKMQKMMAENKATQAALNAEKRKYAKLTDEEAASVKNLCTELKWLNDEDKNVVEYVKKKVAALDVEKKSYNELQQTYNAVRDAINKMTPEQLKATETGKILAATGLKIRDAMNEMQKATGNYTLQVGKYRAAFDGLGYSMQQILREAPSALNLNQFFLAISNNIPMFLDQLKAFQDEQKEIKANLAQMTEGTKEYAEQLGKVESVAKKLGRTLVSWQSLVLVGLMVLRNLPKIVEWVKSLFKKVEEGVDRLREMRKIIMDIDASVATNISKTKVELEEIVRRLGDVTRGTEEWRNIVSRVNEITGETLDATKAMPGDIEKATEAYLKQAEQLAKNQFVIDKIAESANNAFKREQAQGAMSIDDQVSAILGVNASEEDIEKLKKRILKIRQVKTILEEQEWGGSYRDETPQERSARMEKEYEALFNEYLPTRTADELDALWKKYYKPLATKTTSGSGGSQPSEKDITDHYWEAEQALIEAMKVGYSQETALAKLQRDKERDAQIEWYTDQVLALEENAKNEMWSEERIAYERQELKRQNDAQMEKINREHLQRMDAINTKYAEMDRQVVIEEEKNKIEELDELYKVQENNRKRRIRTIKEEELSNLRIVESIQKMQDEIAALNALNLTQPEAIEQRTKRIEELGKAIEKMRQQIEYTKQLSNYSSIGDIFKRNGAFNVSGNMKTSILGSILGEDVVGKMSGDQIEGAFDTWLDNAGKSISTWYNTTMGYINDLIGAYVDLANAKAEAAKEATEAAQEEYEKEKALLEAGYASRVEATWAEYQEKKAAQEQAEKDAKAAAEAQQQLNEISTLGSLVTASANIWKTFTEIPVVGVPLAIAAIGTMFGSFLAAKMKAAQVSQYGEGGFEVLEGGSHASGHDIDLGVNNRRGRRMHAEGKEGIGIFRIAAMQHYGADAIENVVNGINHLEYEQSVGRTLSLQRDMGLHNTMILPRTNLHRLESGVDKLVAIGSNSRYYDPDGTEVITTASGTTRIRRR